MASVAIGCLVLGLALASFANPIAYVRSLSGDRLTSMSLWRAVRLGTIASIGLCLASLGLSTAADYGGANFGRLLLVAVLANLVTATTLRNIKPVRSA